MVVLSIDPGVTTGWTIIRKRDGAVLGMGNLGMYELGTGLDLLIRMMHREGHEVRVVVEEVPQVRGVRGDLAQQLAFVAQTIHHWVEEVYQLESEYVLPGTWKPAPSTKLNHPPEAWRGVALSQHMKDAYGLAQYWMSKNWRAAK